MVFWTKIALRAIRRRRIIGPARCRRHRYSTAWPRPAVRRPQTLNNRKIAELYHLTLQQRILHRILRLRKLFGGLYKMDKYRLRILHRTLQLRMVLHAKKERMSKC